MLEELMHIAVTMDIWTSVATPSYITVTAYFISSNWELKICLLQPTSFPENPQLTIPVRSYKKFCQIFM